MIKVLIGAPVRQKEFIFKEYLESLRALKVDEDIHVDIHFIFNNCNFSNMLDKETHEIYFSEDEYICMETTHQWKPTNFTNVIKMKNKLLEKTVTEGYDYFFLVDSDLVLHEYTLQHLLNQINHSIVPRLDDPNP